jgi:hypothetical protein
MAVLSCSQAIEIKSQTEAEWFSGSDIANGIVDTVIGAPDAVNEAVDAVSEAVDAAGNLITVPDTTLTL